jgi:hypothetical protein
MSKAVSNHSLSYYDWEKTFKNPKRIDSNEEEKVNSLGISNDTFNIFIEKWRKENL